ncbi:MAG: leucine-rich repeat protein [Clostridia bacterium]|nr:leucine-rich repeat protein [Clostridia bacterium]
MKKSVKKIVLLVMIVSVFLTCFAVTASAASGTDINGSKCDFTYNTSDSTATLTKSANTSQSWKLPSTVSCKVGTKYPTFTVTEISAYFFVNSSYGKYVTYLRLPSSLKTIPNGLFQSGVGYLKTLEIYGADTTCNDYFLGCTALKEFVVNADNTNLKAVDGVLYGGTELMKFPAAKALTDTTVYDIPEDTSSIRAYAFYKVKNITDIKVPATVASIGSGAFCDSTVTGVHFENGSTYDFSAYNCTCGTCADRISWCVEDEEAVEATCSVPGHTPGIRCDITGEWFSGEVIPATGKHEYSEFLEARPATCTENMVRVYKCTGCTQTEEKAIPDSALGHKGGEATCTALAICGVCGEGYGELNTDNHKNITTLEAVAPTCEDTGLTEGKYCADCKIAIVAQTVVDALGHKGGEATCEEPAVCGVCGEAYGNALNHDIIIDKVVEPDCVNTGLTAGQHCSRCDAVTVAQKVIPAVGHKETAVAGKTPTCTDAGLTDGIKCGVCGEVLSAQEELAPLGHADENADGICDNGGEGLRSPQDDCTHLCHKTGFMGFIWKIVRFFQKLFKMNPVCKCGALHY